MIKSVQTYLEYPKNEFNYHGSSDFNIKVGKKDGEKILNSDMFKNTLKYRIIQ